MADNNNDAAADQGEEAMNNDDDNVTVAVTKIAALPTDNPKMKRFAVTFDNFKDLPSEMGHEVQSSIFSCFQTDFCVELYPGGDDEDGEEGADNVMIGIKQKSKGEALKIKYSVGLKDTATNNILNMHKKYSHGKLFDEETLIKGVAWFCFDDSWSHRFRPRDDILKEYLDRSGALTVYVTLQMKEYIPKNPTSTMILNLFNNQDSADIVFEVCEQRKRTNDRKRAKASTHTFHAHRLILQNYSTELAALCATSEGMTSAIVDDVKPEAFRHLLYYVYGGEIGEEDFVQHAKDLINAADKYGVTNLKLEAEVWYVQSTKITIENVIDNLLYADAMNCALLKEALMDFMVEKKVEVMQRVSFDDVPGHICKDLLAAMARCGDVSSDDDDDEEEDIEKNYSKMRIGDLRQKLDEKGLSLDIDGSREALISTLKEHS